MKVCTDSCLFGAWVADKIERKVIAPKKILDIGTGTGLLTLILAQKTSALIDAVEVDKNSFEQAVVNFYDSPWNEYLQAFSADIKNWKASAKYDLIICNPPFFENDLKSVEENKNVAMHDKGLMLTDLIYCIKVNLDVKGCVAVLLPYHRISYFEKLATENNLHLAEKLLIRQTPAHQYFRGILFFSNQIIDSISNELIIRDEKGNYTDSFTKLLEDYYLAL